MAYDPGQRKQYVKRGGGGGGSGKPKAYGSGGGGGAGGPPPYSVRQFNKDTEETRYVGSAWPARNGKEGHFDIVLNGVDQLETFEKEFKGETQTCARLILAPSLPPKSKDGAPAKASAKPAPKPAAKRAPEPEESDQDWEGEDDEEA